MTREQLETLVNEATGRTDKSSLTLSALNLAVAEVSSQRLWYDMMVQGEATILEGALSIDLASDVARVASVTVVDDTLSRPLLCRSRTWVSERYADPTSWPVERPQFGYLEGRTLFMVPRPDQDYVIRYNYYKLHPDLDTPTSELLIRHATAAVVAYAAFWVFQSIEKLKEAEQWYGTYLRQLQSAKRVDADNSVTKYQMTPRGENQVYGDYWLDPFVRTQR